MASSSDETLEQLLLRLSRQMDEMTRGMSELMTRQNALDSQMSNLMAQQTSAGTPVA